MTAGHPTLSRESDGRMQSSIQHVGGDIHLPATPEDLDQLVNRWGREVARAAGIPAWEPEDATPSHGATDAAKS
jgi:hypothetical protein